MVGEERVCTIVDCSRCGRCCREPIVPVTYRDVLRISRFLKQPPQRFVRFFSPSEMNYDPDAPLWIRFRYGKRAMGLKRVSEKCVFLSGDFTCSVYKNRPVTCRSFPHSIELNSKNRKIESVTLNKITQCKAKPSHTTVENDLIKIAKQEIREDSHYYSIIEKWNSSRKTGGVKHFLAFLGFET
ncbi:YkgJ family cysteine cluster protein [Chitinispirillales bacterium ANBcel5]|uniref:YkgJ family cysteine cluster protein n=1 Tax=Cellulosispirillum alkaliphilum TaxID=3039283 RepID=UPI002A548857|nr:YkgJ family cysteine cluster protein [Chitinispirillales bacterium ANBcel5]